MFEGRSDRSLALTDEEGNGDKEHSAKTDVAGKTVGKNIN